MYFKLTYMNYKKWLLLQAFHTRSRLPIVTDHIRNAVKFMENGNSMPEISATLGNSSRYAGVGLRTLQRF